MIMLKFSEILASLNANLCRTNVKVFYSWCIQWSHYWQIVGAPSTKYLNDNNAFCKTFRTQKNYYII